MEKIMKEYIFRLYPTKITKNKRTVVKLKF